MNSKKEKNYYELLGVPFDATLEEIKVVYRELARIHHPDSVRTIDNPNATPDPEFFKEISQAYATLGNIERRQEYDLSLQEEIEDTEKHWSKDLPAVNNEPYPTTRIPAPLSESGSDTTIIRQKEYATQRGVWQKDRYQQTENVQRLRLLIIVSLGVLVGVICALIVFLFLKSVL
jgi:curved DNA-binding protein CbpA